MFSAPVEINIWNHFERDGSIIIAAYSFKILLVTIVKVTKIRQQQLVHTSSHPMVGTK